MSAIEYASVPICMAGADGRQYVYGYIPTIVAKCGMYLKEKGIVTYSTLNNILCEVKINESIIYAIGDTYRYVYKYVNSQLFQLHQPKVYLDLADLRRE